MIENIKSWSYLPKVNEIIESQKFYELVKKFDRELDPEFYIPKYSLINHAKVDFVKYVIEKEWTGKEVKYLGWIDFGYVRNSSQIPSDYQFKYQQLKNDRVNMIYNMEFVPEDENVTYVMENHEVTITGPFWFGTKNKILSYWDLYHERLNYIFSLGLVDDDQTIMVK